LKLQKTKAAAHYTTAAFVVIRKFLNDSLKAGQELELYQCRFSACFDSVCRFVVKSAELKHCRGDYEKMPIYFLWSANTFVPVRLRRTRRADSHLSLLQSRDIL
jgi:hypothetical protein